MTDAAAVIERVRQRVDPTPAERRALAAAASRLTERAEAAIAELPVAADVVQVGSTARGTWVAGDRDIDLFVRFPSDLPANSQRPTARPWARRCCRTATRSTPNTPT